MLMSIDHPWRVISPLNRELGRLFAGEREEAAAPRSWSPRVDIEERDDAYLIRADLPGVEPTTIEIALEEGVLTLRGERHDLPESGLRRHERAQGRFERRFTLPEDVQAEGIAARSRHGVLEVTLPKAEQPQPRRIEVKVETA